MIWKTVFGIIPVPVRYTDDLPADVGGRAVYNRVLPYIEIASRYRDDQGILAHELRHCAQFYGMALLLAMLNVPIAAVLHLAAGVPWGYPVTAVVVTLASLLIHPQLYTWRADYRLWAEADAYRVQMQYPDANGHCMTIDEAAGRLMSPRYRLDVIWSEAVASLRP